MLKDQEAKTRRRRVLTLINSGFALLGLCLASVIAAPQLLAFPYQAQIGATRIYAESPVDIAKARQMLRRADERLATSPLHDGPVGTRIFLTDGGWRWRVLALSSSDAVGLTRPLSDVVSDAVILNRSDVARDRTNSVRTLSGIIAHERTHILVRRHLGLVRGIALPRWISEGYADHVAGEPDPDDPDLARLGAARPDHPLFFYLDARRRVEAALAASGNDVDALLASR